MAGRGNGQEFRDTFDDAENDDVQEILHRGPRKRDRLRLAALVR
jgi:hypothetical protein